MSSTNEISETKAYVAERNKEKNAGWRGEKEHFSLSASLPSLPYPCFFSFELRPGIVCPHACTWPAQLAELLCPGSLLPGYFLGGGAATRSKRRSREGFSLAAKKRDRQNHYSTRPLIQPSTHTIISYPDLRGGSRVFFRRGCTRLLLYFNTNKPHSFFFAEYQLY